MWRDDAQLLDMLLAARRAIEHAREADWERFARDSLLQDAVVMRLTLLGEAASRVSETCRAAHPEIAWRTVVAMRNRLVHDYRQVSLEIVWRTLRDDVPLLVAQLEPLVPPEDE